MRIPRVNVEINLLMKCNAACANCNRGVREFPEREDMMTVAQIEDFIAQARSRQDVKIKKVKLVGGEPTIHPDFEQIYHLLLAAVDDGVIEGLKVNTNTIKGAPPSTTVKHPKVRWLHSPLKKKRHLPYVLHPKDLGLEAKGPCRMPFTCGFSLDPRGWLPCSPAILIAGAFDLEHLYRDDIPKDFWGHSLCDHCVFAVPESWRSAWHKQNRGLTLVEPSPRWKAGLENYAAKHDTKLRLPTSKNAKIPLVMA